ncbi:ubiquitin-like small modifier protein 1 [Haloprofundus halobius]|uniref:ubiquitin-like small modifier protein 1 n=1 Tax=Haloprofundus halobius TaxID=2876194 RepID=UPI001CCAA5F7|nr:ubiquitin-like small modifier protein 1 [Haloprofundus halobius]
MKVLVYGPLRSVTGEKTIELTVDGNSVQDAVESFVSTYPRTASQLVDEEDKIRPSVRILIEDERVSLNDTLSSDATMKLFPAMRGGSVTHD